ncbi:MAG TPA: riboflavin synthase [Myxococcales bacterium]|nr:riboflavin synthase [Deltaproteobacteria bacterium]MBU47981.1 riboflavin synthase [Deltaproteobacteria bacterium]HAA54328.1 riboflavin synthase [Myxococcales bacterium]|tara:strand:- start:2403 stop:3062 length:660 start_codon:yes stop_codon:yes gene_type:complete
MFTGIVQAHLPISTLETHPGLYTIGLPMLPVLGEGLQLGASVAVDGVCLTVTRLEGEEAFFDAMQETLQKTTLGQCKLGTYVNVERSMKMGDEIGGHIVSGHVKHAVEIVDVKTTENNHVVTFQARPEDMPYIFPKGFVALDGASLTIVDVDKEKAQFNVWLIPETLKRTTFGHKGVGEFVNIEIDSKTQAIVDTVEHILEDRLNALLKDQLAHILQNK